MAKTKTTENTTTQSTKDEKMVAIKYEAMNKIAENYQKSVRTKNAEPNDDLWFNGWLNWFMY